VVFFTLYVGLTPVQVGLGFSFVGFHHPFTALATREPAVVA